MSAGNSPQMRAGDIDVLKERQRRQGTVRLHMNDGEQIVARVLFVSDFNRDVIVDLISTTEPGRYERDDVQPVFAYGFGDIGWVEPVEAN